MFANDNHSHAVKGEREREKKNENNKEMAPYKQNDLTIEYN